MAPAAALPGRFGRPHPAEGSQALETKAPPNRACLIKGGAEPVERLILT